MVSLQWSDIFTKKGVACRQRLYNKVMIIILMPT
jgi:hypothetical protein